MPCGQHPGLGRLPSPTTMTLNRLLLWPVTSGLTRDQIGRLGRTDRRGTRRLPHGPGAT